MGQLASLAESMFFRSNAALGWTLSWTSSQQKNLAFDGAKLSQTKLAKGASESLSKESL
jgi:hypothetical protein